VSSTSPIEEGFIHLRVRSAYSVAEGAVRVTEDAADKEAGYVPVRKDLIELCSANKMPAVALTDTGNLFGAMEFAKAAVGKGIQPIIGVHVFVPAFSAENTKKHASYKLVLLVQNEKGYKNLSALITKSFTDKKRAFPFVTYEELAEKSEGLIALSAGLDGEIASLLLMNKKEEALRAAEKLSQIFPERFYIELNRHVNEEEAGEKEEIYIKERNIEQGLIDAAYLLDIPLVATNDVYFGEADMYEAHDALLCISEKTTIADENRRKVTKEHYFKSAKQMRKLFKDIPEACNNTVVIAQRCAYMPPVRDPILPVFSENEDRDLRARAKEGLEIKFQQMGSITKEKRKLYEDRLNYELDVINKMGFPGYFLIVSDFIKWSKDNGVIVGPGRGSGAGSLVAWTILITDLDPIKYDLLFERFMNPDRVSMPDFDIDFCQQKREKTIEYVQQKYGADRVAQIITFGKLQARNAVRSIGRVLGMPYGQIDKISKLIPAMEAGKPVKLATAIMREPELKKLQDEDTEIAHLMDLALKIEGLLGNASTHAAGIVIGDRPLVELVPLYQDPSARLPATQFDMKSIESTGLVKFDFLGLKTLDVLQMTVDFIQENDKIKLDLNAIPLDDEKTFAMLSRGDTTGVFQLESAGMRDVLRNMKPNRLEDIIALGALYRPGPMENIPKYIKCKNGDEEVEYLHTVLKPVLESTFGILIYQEQVMQAAQILSGYSLGAADLLRRAMGKKNAKEMKAQRTRFIEGAQKKHEVPKKQAGEIFDHIEKFANYGFNKSHSAAYAVIAYQTAYLKANYPVEFFAAAMNFELGNLEKIAIFKQELKKIRVQLLPPDINKSYPVFKVEEYKNKKAIRYAFCAIKGVGEKAMEAVVEVRDSKDFKDVFDFAERAGSHVVNKKMLEGLIFAGAFDNINKNRAQLYAGMDLITKYAQSETSDKESGQSSIFDMLSSGAGMSKPVLPVVKNWDDITKLKNEFSAIGFYLSAHPMDSYRAMLDRIGAKKYQDILNDKRLSSSRVKLAGVVTAKQERISKKSGSRFAVITVSDDSGEFEVMIFSDLLAEKREVLEEGKSIFLEVECQLASKEPTDGVASEPVLRLIAKNIEPFEDVALKSLKGMKIKLFDVSDVAEIKKVLEDSPKGKACVILNVSIDETLEADIELKGGWTLDELAKTKLRQIGDGLVIGEY